MSDKTQKATSEIETLPAMVGGSTLAYLFGVSDSYISKMAERGIIPKSGRGQYPFVACLQAYISYLDAGTTGEEEDKTNYQAEKTRLTAAQADKAELDYKITQGEYIAAHEVATAWNKIMGEVKAQMMNLPSKIGPLAVGVQTPDEGFQVVMKFIRPMLKELSETDVSVESYRPPET
jgi:hypothetical protein